MSTTGKEREKQERNEEGKEDISDIDRVEGFIERERERPAVVISENLLILCFPNARSLSVLLLGLLKLKKAKTGTG